MSEAAREYLQAMWLDMRDGAGPEAQARAAGSVEMAHYLGALTAEQAELWLRRVRSSCPGHDDEGGRDWCAYCGEMNREPTHEERSKNWRCDLRCAGGPCVGCEPIP